MRAKAVGIPLDEVSDDLRALAASENAQIYIAYDGDDKFLYATFIPLHETENIN